MNEEHAARPARAERKPEVRPGTGAFRELPGPFAAFVRPCGEGRFEILLKLGTRDQIPEFCTAVGARLEQEMELLAVKRSRSEEKKRPGGDADQYPLDGLELRLRSLPLLGQKPAAPREGGERADRPGTRSHQSA